MLQSLARSWSLPSLACAALLITSGCKSLKKSPPCIESLAPHPKSQKHLPSTHARIYENNLLGHIETLKASFAKAHDATQCTQLNRAMFTLAQYHGNLEEMDEAIALLDQCSPVEPIAAQLALTRASQLQSLHKFVEAGAQIKRAQEAGAPMAQIQKLQDELDWNLGNYDSALPAIRSEAAKHPTVKSLARLAMLEHTIGNYDEADGAFAAAETRIRDTNPLTVAWLFVQRGHHHMELGEWSVAQAFFEEAVKRLPNYVAATEHLGEVLALQEKYTESIVHYEHTLTQSKNPEFIGALAGVYQSAGMATKANEATKRADTGYRERIKSHPDAMSWHAASFFLEQGEDPELARTLLVANAKARPNSEAWLALALTQQSLQRHAEAKLSIDKALATPARSVELFELAAAIETSLGNPKASQAHHERQVELEKKISNRFQSCQ